MPEQAQSPYRNLPEKQLLKKVKMAKINIHCLNGYNYAKTYAKTIIEEWSPKQELANPANKDERDTRDAFRTNIYIEVKNWIINCAKLGVVEVSSTCFIPFNMVKIFDIEYSEVETPPTKATSFYYVFNRFILDGEK